MQVEPRYEGEPIISIEASSLDPLTPMARQRRRLEALLGGLDDSDWAAPSRCDGWTVQDVVSHLVTVNGFWAVSVRDGLAGAPTRYLVGFDPAATPAMLVDPMRSLSPAEVLDQFVASNDALIGCLTDLDDASWSMPAEAPPGHLPVHLVSDHALWDSWVHERDIALPLGSIPPVEADEVAASLRYVAALSPGFAITAGAVVCTVLAIDATDPALQLVLEVGDSVVVRDGPAPAGAPCLCGDAVELLDALSIRAPLPPSTPTEWRQSLAGLARVFDAPVES